MADPTTATELALIKQEATNLASEIRRVDANCDERSKVSDAKLDRLQWWLFTTMAMFTTSLVLAVIGFLLSK